MRVDPSPPPPLLRERGSRKKEGELK